MSRAVANSRAKRSRVAQDVTLVVKTFERPNAARRVIQSARRFYPEIPVVLVDDSAAPLDPRPDGIEYVRLPFNSGLSAGRNEGLRCARTPYVLFADDDHVFGCETDVYCLLRALEATDFAVVSAAWIEHRPRTNETWEKHFAGTVDMVDGAYYHRIGANRGYQRGLPRYDVVMNFFLADRAQLGDAPWDSRLKIGAEHGDFFLTLKQRGIGVTKLSRVAVHHHPEWSSPGYMSYRHDTGPYLEIFREKWGITHEVVETVAMSRRTRASQAWLRALSLIHIPA